MTHAHSHGPYDAAADAPLDAGNQSLANALRASFRILKFVMFVLVVLYCFSGLQCINQHEQAVVFRFGRLLPEVREPGLSWAFPYPIDETLRFPTKRANQFLYKGHWPKMRPEEEAQSLGAVRAAGGLDPALDGALLTADRGIAHVQWKVTYRVDDLRKYVLHVADEKVEDAQQLIQTVLDKAAIEVVSQYGAEAATRGRTAEVAAAVKGRINEALADLNTGLLVETLDIPRSSVPGPTIAAFDAVTTAENTKQKDIREAQQRADDILNGTAGAAYESLLAKLDERDVARQEKNDKQVAELDKEIDEMLDDEVAGLAGEKIREANAYYTQTVQGIQGEVEEYKAVLDEYLRAPRLFVNRMWEQTRREILQRDGVRKRFLAKNVDEVRLKIGPDPLQRDIDERLRLRKEAEEHRFETKKNVQMILSE